MSKMKRLTGRNRKGDLLFMGIQVYAGDFYEAASALEEYEDAEEEGRLVILPCGLGDTIYRIRPTLDGIVICRDIVGHNIERIKRDEANLIWFICNDGYSFNVCEIGRTVFLTCEEAEKALKERSKRG